MKDTKILHSMVEIIEMNRSIRKKNTSFQK